MGFRKDNLLVVAGNGLVRLGGRESFVQRLRTNPGILDVAVTEAVPFGTYGVGLLAGHLPGHAEPVALSKLVIGSNMAQLMGARLIAGRFLSDDRAQDHFVTPPENSTAAANDDRNILIDETAARNFGFTPQQAIGKTIVMDKSHVHVVG